MQRKLLGLVNVDFDATGQLLIIYSAFVHYLRQNGNIKKQFIRSSRQLMNVEEGGLV